MVYNKRRKIIFGLFALLILIYIAFYISLLTLDKCHEHQQLFLLGIIVISTLAMFIAFLQEKSILLNIGTLIIFISSSVAFIFDIFKLDSMNPIFQFLFHVITSIGLIILLIGIYKVVILNYKKSQIFYSYEVNEALFIEYHHKKKIIYIEFSKLFKSKYSGIKEKYIEVDTDVFLTYLYPEDYKRLRGFRIDIESNYFEYKFRVKFPGMNDYAFILARGTSVMKDKFVFLGFDISEFEAIHNNIKEITKENELLDLEKRKIIETTEDLVARFTTDGIIIYASSSYAKLFSLDADDIIGKNIFILNKEKNRFDNEWFFETIKNHTYRSKSKENIEGKDVYISWHNDVLLNENGDVEYIITVGRDITELMLLNQDLEHQSLHDYTTGLLNNRGLYKRLKEISNIKKAICFYIDILQFSQINDYYGNEIGEELLKQIADELNIIAEKHLIARVTGEHFCVICFNLNYDEEQNIIKKISQSVNSIYHVNKSRIHVLKRVGYAKYPDDTDDLKSLVSLSSLAKNEITENTPTKILKYKPYMSALLFNNISMSEKLREALINQVLEVHFQKIVNTNTKEITFIEALARWYDNDAGYVPPDYFFNIAKQASLINYLDEYIFQRAIEQFARLKQQEEYKNTILTLNIAPTTLLRSDVPQLLEEIAHNNQLLPIDICIEISENTFVHNLDLCRKHIKEFKQRGFLIAIDDFGREYSSLAILDSIDFDTIKIDGSFVNNIEKPQSQAIVKMIMTISELSNKIIIAECVETDKEVQILQSLNCYLQQGYYHHKPERL